MDKFIHEEIEKQYILRIVDSRLRKSPELESFEILTERES